LLSGKAGLVFNLSPRRKDMEGLQMWLHTFLTSALDVSERSVSGCGRLIGDFSVSRWLGVSQSWSGGLGKRNNLLRLAGIKMAFLEGPPLT
jgi:hypothetical protein